MEPADASLTQSDQSEARRRTEAPDRHPDTTLERRLSRLGRAVLSRIEPIATVSPSFLIDPRSGVPLYLQLIEQVKRAVALGTLQPGEQLPTVKALALDLTINPNTVARAYRELERDRVIETRVGRGSFVHAASGAGDTSRAVEDIASGALDAAVREARSLGLSRSAVRAHVDRALERWFPAGPSPEDR